MERCTAGNRLHDEGAEIAVKCQSKAAVELWLKRIACHIPCRERCGRKSCTDRFTLEGVLVVERSSAEGVVADVRQAEHFKRGGRVGCGIASLYASSVKPCHMSAVATQPV